MNEEIYIQERVGKRNPFRVPEGYFDSFADQLMQQLPERQPRAKRIWLRPVFYAAAALCALVVSVAVWFSLPDTSVAEQPALQLASQQESLDASFDEAADYMMLDNHDIYAYLADN